MISQEDGVIAEILRAIHLEIHQLRKGLFELRPELEKWVVWLTTGRK